MADRLSNYAVLYIDLLGQRDKIKASNAVLMPPDPEHCNRIADEIISDYQWLRTWLRALVQAPDTLGTAQIPAPPLPNLPFKVQRFSDGFSAYVPVTPRPSVETVYGIYKLVRTAGQLCILGLAERRPLRGGLAMGWAAEFDGAELCGCAMAEVHTMETVAGWPRVTVGVWIERLIQAIQQLPDDVPQAAWLTLMGQRLANMICVDRDVRRAVHYLGDNFRTFTYNAAGNDQQPADLFKAAQVFIAENVERWKASGNDKLLGRYVMVQDYFDHHAAAWKAAPNRSDSGGVHP